jgi:hypothetical protein
VWVLCLVVVSVLVAVAVQASLKKDEFGPTLPRYNQEVEERELLHPKSRSVRFNHEVDYNTPRGVPSC